jgi:hypothetical protein
MLVATIDADIGDRYEVRFRDRLVPLDSGRFYALAEHGSLTAQIGQFSLVKNWNLPDDFPSKAYPEGTWCHITEWTVKYNALNTQFGRYEPACTEVRASK